MKNNKKIHLFLNRWCYVQFSVPQHYTFTLQTHETLYRILSVDSIVWFLLIRWILTSACSRCASCSVSNVTKPYPLLTPARSTMIFVDLTLPYDENTRQSSASVVSPLIKQLKQRFIWWSHVFSVLHRCEYHMTCLPFCYSPDSANENSIRN